MSRTPFVGFVVAAIVLAAASPAFAQVSFVGDWAGRYHEDQPDRVPGEEPGDFSGIPLNEAAPFLRRQLERGPVLGARAPVRAVHAAVHLLRAESVPHLGGAQPRYAGTAGHPDVPGHVPTAPHHLDGRPARIRPNTRRTRSWASRPASGTATSSRSRPRTSRPASSGAAACRRAIAPRSSSTGCGTATLLSQVTIATDPVYLTEPYIRSQEFVLMERGNQNWLYNCEYVDGGAAGQNRGAALPARREPVPAGVRGEACDAAGRRARRRRDAAARVEARRAAAAVRGREERRLQARAAAVARCRRATCGPSTCRATST